MIWIGSSIRGTGTAVPAAASREGAATIDWVALTPGILLLGIIVAYAIFNTGVNSLVSNVNSNLVGASVGVSIGTVINQNP